MPAVLTKQSHSLLESSRVRHARSTHQNRHRLWVLKRKGDFQLAVFPWGKVAWEWNKQQLKVLSLFRLAFHTWPFLGRVSLVPRPYSLGTRLRRSSHARLQALVGFSPENVIHLKCILPSRYDPLSNNQTACLTSSKNGLLPQGQVFIHVLLGVKHCNNE